MKIGRSKKTITIVCREYWCNQLKGELYLLFWSGTKSSTEYGKALKAPRYATS